MSQTTRFIRSFTPQYLRRFIAKTGEFFNTDLDPHKQFPRIEATLRTLHRLGLDTKCCIDVGAYHGEWTKLFKNEFPQAKVLMIEAQESKRPILEQVMALYPNEVDLEMALLGAVDGKKVVFTEMATGSSVYAETSAYSRTTVEKTLCSLDTLVTQRRYSSVDFLKLDVQGYELEILKGAAKVLSSVTAVLLEASLIPINQNCPLIAEVIAFMDRAGFTLFDFCSQIRRKDGVLWQTDLLFLRTDSEIIPKPLLDHENWH